MCKKTFRIKVVGKGLPRIKITGPGLPKITREEFAKLTGFELVNFEELSERWQRIVSHR